MSCIINNAFIKLDANSYVMINVNKNRVIYTTVVDFVRLFSKIASLKNFFI